MLGGLAGGRSPPHDVALMGPRGNGKTVLLNWFERRCRRAAKVDTARLSPSRIRTEQALVDALLPATGVKRILPWKLGISGVGEVEWAASSPSAQNLTARLTARCRKRPLVVLLDEAHVLERDVGQLLLNVSQEVRADAPFLLVLAGTPGLLAHLSAMNASFWSRLGEGRLGIGLLSDAATRASLVEPLAAHGALSQDLWQDGQYVTYDSKLASPVLRGCRDERSGVDFETRQEPYAMTKSHVNSVVPDTAQCEQSAPYQIDRHEQVQFRQECEARLRDPIFAQRRASRISSRLHRQLTRDEARYMIVETKGLAPLRDVKE